MQQGASQVSHQRRKATPTHVTFKITKIACGTRDGSFMSRGQLLFRKNENSWGHTSKPSWGNEAEAQRRTRRWMVNLNKCPGFHSRRCSETLWRLAWVHACNRSLSGCFRQLTTRPALYFGSFCGFLLRKTNTKAVLTQTCHVFRGSRDSFFSWSLSSNYGRFWLWEDKNEQKLMSRLRVQKGAHKVI